MARLLVNCFWLCAVSVALAGLFENGSIAQDPATRLVGESNATQTRKRLTEAQSKIANRQYAEAMQDLLKILEESGSDLVLVEQQDYQPARRLVQKLLATLPPDQLEVLRDRLEIPAGQLWKRGEKRRDVQALQKLIQQYYVSRPAEKALLLLGEIAFERGQFRQATQYWSQLQPTSDTTRLTYPQPKVPQAFLQAKILLARIFNRNSETIATDLATFAKDYPESRGYLAGEEGLLKDILHKWHQNPPKLAVNEASSWSTFAGQPNRLGQVVESLPHRWPFRPTWQSKIPRSPGSIPIPRPFNREASSTLAYHPILVDGFAYIADDSKVYSFRLSDGESRVAYDLIEIVRDWEVNDQDPANSLNQNIDYTLTYADGLILARLGNTSLLRNTPDQNLEFQAKLERPMSWIVGLKPIRNVELPKNALTLSRQWFLAPPANELLPRAWQGAPIVHDGKIYAAFSRIENNRLIQSLACYSEPETQQPDWVVDLCEEDPNRTVLYPNRQQLLCLAEDKIIFTSHTGVTLAVLANSGQFAWAFRNESSDATKLSRANRDLSPAIYHQGKVFFAPADSEFVYALNADTGQPVWQAGPFLVKQMLGIAQEKLIVTINAPQHGLRGLNIENGSDQAPNGWRNHDDPFLSTYGRGIAQDDCILWPSRQKMYPIHPKNGTVASLPIPGPQGNLAYADGVLIVATPTEVHGFVTRSQAADAERDQIQQQEIQSILQPKSDPNIVRQRIRSTANPELKLRLVLEAERQLGLNRTQLINPDEWQWNWMHESGQPPRPVIPRVVPPRPKLSTALPQRQQAWQTQSAFVPPLNAEPVQTLSLPWRTLQNADSTTISNSYAVSVGLIAKLGESPKEIQWTIPFPEAEKFRRQLVTPTCHVLFGDRQILALATDAPKILWNFEVPLEAASLESRQEEAQSELPRPRPVFTSVHTSSNHLIGLIGNHLLCCIDLFTGELLWVKDAQGRSEYSPFAIDSAPQFSRAITIHEKLAVVHRSDGNVWFLEIKSGKLMREWPTTCENWQCPAQIIEENNIVFPESPLQIVAVNLQSLRVLWRYEVPGEVSATGESPWILELGEHLLIGIQRNYGLELLCLEMNTREQHWPKPVLFREPQPKVQDWFVHEGYLTLLIAQRLSIIELRSGRCQQGDRLPDRGSTPAWKLHQGRHATFAYLTLAKAPTPFAELWPRLRARCHWTNSISTWCGLIGSVVQNWTNSQTCLVAIHPQTGQIQQALPLTVFGPDYRIAWTGDQPGLRSTGQFQVLRKSNKANEN